MNPDLRQLQAYPFERLAALKAGIQAPANLTPVALSIGEPKHAAPAFVLETLRAHLSELSAYPLTCGMDTLRETIAAWLSRRFELGNDIDPATQILPVSGTREALFAFAQAVIDRHNKPLVLMPNPFYQIYEGAALLAGAEPWFLNTTHETGYLPDFAAVPDKVWQRCQLLYICSPGNPTGRVIPQATLAALINLAETHDFIIASDECYAELYFDETAPPPGLLQAAQSIGNTEYKRCVVFHSLSKRSNLPGLRSGFVAGDKDILAGFLKYRTYHGCALPPPTQQASNAAWSDEHHVVENRRLYREKFTVVSEILQDVLPVDIPAAGFYLWPHLPIDDTRFAQQLFAQQNVTVLPGQYLSRHAHGQNPGQNYVRLALVAELEQCRDAAQRIREFMQKL